MVEGVWELFLRGGDGDDAGVSSAIDGSGGSGCDNGFPSCGVQDGELSLRDGIVGGAVVEVDGAWDYFAAVRELGGIVEY